MTWAVGPFGLHHTLKDAENYGGEDQSLKVPKREIFVTELFILSDPIWVGDLRTESKKPFV